MGIPLRRDKRPASSRDRRLGSFSSRLRKRQTARGLQPTPAASSPPGSVRVRWLSEAEDLLTAIVALLVRGAGSIVYGYIALFRHEPSKYLIELEARGKVLPWATLVLVASAVSAVLLDVVVGGALAGPWQFAQDLMARVAPDSFMGRFLPTLAFGLLVCMAACAWWLLSGAEGNIAGVRLFASTYFAVCVTSFLVALSATAVATEDLEMATDVELSAVSSIRTLAVYVVPAVSVGPLIIGSVLQFLRGLFRLGPRLPWVVRFLLRAWGCLPAIATGAMAPLLIARGCFLALEYAPYVASYTDLSSHENPMERATFKPYPVYCHSDGMNGKAIDCLLYAATSGKGRITLKLDEAEISLSQEPLGASGLESYRFSEKNRVRGRIRGSDMSLENGAVRLTQSLSDRRPMESIELGSPAALILRFELPGACHYAKLVLNRNSDKNHLYLHLEVMRTDAEEHWVALGPWESSKMASQLEVACRETAGEHRKTP